MTLADVPPHIVERWKRTEQANRRRARKKGADALPVNFVKIIIDFNARCCICFDDIDIHLPGTDPRGLTLEHLLALGQGGHHVSANVGPAHNACNQAKNNQEDTPKAAKVNRVKTKFEEFFERMEAKNAEPQPAKAAGKHKQIAGAGFRGSRKFNGEVSWKTK
jgi:5-methylcytosine-specific restriction endonuclease McrA